MFVRKATRFECKSAIVKRWHFSLDPRAVSNIYPCFHSQFYPSSSPSIALQSLHPFLHPFIHSFIQQTPFIPIKEQHSPLSTPPTAICAFDSYSYTGAESTRSPPPPGPPSPAGSDTGAARTADPPRLMRPSCGPPSDTCDAGRK